MVISPRHQLGKERQRQERWRKEGRWRSVKGRWEEKVGLAQWWLHTAVTPKCCWGIWQRTELKPKCCCGWGGRRVELRVPWLPFPPVPSFPWSTCVPVLWHGRHCVAYLASSPMLLLKSVPAHQVLGCRAVMLRASSSRVKSRGWTGSQKPTMPAKSPKVKKGLIEVIQILHFILRGWGWGVGGCLVVAGFSEFYSLGFFLNPSISIFQYFSAITGAGNFGFH